MGTDYELHNRVIFESIRADGSAAAEALYAGNRSAFLRWANARYNVGADDLEDIWQDAVIAFVEQVRSNKVTTLQCTVRTWLFAIAYRKLLHFRRKQARMVFFGPSEDLLKSLPMPEKPDEHPQAHLLSTLLEQLSPACRDILHLRFYEEKNIRDIMLQLNLANENTTSASISRCLGRLRKLIDAQLNRSE